MAPREPITWERARRIFGDAGPPDKVTQHQFDGFDEVLERLAQTPQERIDFGDLWYYHHDLAYQELQPDLFVLLDAGLPDGLASSPCNTTDRPLPAIRSCTTASRKAGS